MKRLCLHLLPILFAALVASLPDLAFAAPGAVRCGKLLDVRAGRMLDDQTVVFDDAGVITSVGPASSATLPAGVSPVDLSGSTCLPGLIDVHTHITGNAN